MNPEDVENKKNPFNIALGAVIYKSVNSNFTNLVEKSLDSQRFCLPKSFRKLGSGLHDYVLAIGSDDLEDARIISDPSKIEELRGYLRSYGGSGKTEEGEDIYRLIMGDIYPLGIAYTLNPAADVRGLYSESDETPSVFIKDKRDKISQNNKINVNIEKDIIAMEIENTISELKELLNEKKFSKEAVASMTDTFAQAIRERDEQYRKDIEAAESAKESAVKQHEELKSSLAELEEKLGTANERISAFENDKRAEEAVARFNERMDDLDQKFELDDEDREFLAKELKGVGEEEAYASFSAKLEVLWKHKSKEAQAAFNAEIQNSHR